MVTTEGFIFAATLTYICESARASHCVEGGGAAEGCSAAAGEATACWCICGARRVMSRNATTIPVASHARAAIQLIDRRMNLRPPCFNRTESRPKVCPAFDSRNLRQVA